MYQWGTVDLANQGYSPEEILKYYYGDDIEIIKNAPVGGVSGLAYSGEPIKPGDSSIFVLRHQLGLNRIARNYPAIPLIDPVDGYYGESTENAVKAFQQIFNLPVTGIIDQATFYKLRYVYIAVSKVSELTTGGSVYEEVLQRTQNVLLQGDIRPRVTILQFFLTVLSSYYSTIPEVQITRTFDPQTRLGVIEFQKTMGLPVTGIVDQKTWDTMYNTILGIINTLPAENVFLPYVRAHGVDYKLGMGTEYPGVLFIQEMLAFISQSEPKVPHINVNGIFDEATEIAVKAFQSAFGLEPTGIVDDKTWNLLTSIYRQKRYGSGTVPAQPQA
jgi:peptidoglycan hydrolase-like protein with peptidoglycan-binding domain